MKKLGLGIALSFGLAAPALAGGMAPAPEPMMEPAVVVEESSGGSGGFVIPLLLLAVVAAVASTD